MRYTFGNYSLDTSRRELLRGASLIPTTPQVFDLLKYLIGNRERLVSKEELIAAIWNGRVVSDSALTTRLNAVRHAIGDSGKSQHLIKTVARRGFRFVGLVREERGPDSLATPNSSWEPPTSSFLPPGYPSIAVLPFADISGNSHHGLVAEGLAEDLLTELAKRNWLVVVSRHLSFIYGQNAVDFRRMGEELGVRYVLEGSVRTLRDRIRITSRLFDAVMGVLVWVDRYERAAAGTFAAHDEITEAMAAAIASAIAHAEQRRAMRKSSNNLGAWEAYQRGMWHMSKCEPAELALAQTFFQRAIDLDPNYAGGHGALAWSHMMAASIFSQMTIAEGCALAEPMVRKATALDENDLESRARLAIASMLQGDLEGAFEDAQRVLSVNGQCAEALGVKGTVLLYSGRPQEGREAIQLHLKLSPRDPARPIRLSQIAASLYIDGNFEAAATTAKQVIRQYPKHPTAYRWLAASLGQLGRVTEGEEVLQRLQTAWPSSFDMYIRQRPRYCSIEHAPLVQGLHKVGWRE